MRVIEVEYRYFKQGSRTATGRSEGIELKVQLDEGDSVQEAIARAKITAHRALGDSPSGAQAEMRAAIMKASASDLTAEAEALLARGFE